MDVPEVAVKRPSRHLMAEVFVTCHTCLTRHVIGTAPLTMISAKMCRERLRETGWHMNVNTFTCPGCQTSETNGGTAE